MSDLISRKAVLEEIQKIECEPGYQHVGEDWAVGLIIAENIVESAESIESTPSAEPERKWIPVTEALPEDDTDVLVQFSNNMAVGYYKYSRWGIATGADLYCRIEDYEEKPIAWMPLPEPYRGE